MELTFHTMSSATGSPAASSPATKKDFPPSCAGADRKCLAPQAMRRPGTIRRAPVVRRLCLRFMTLRRRLTGELSERREQAKP